jgi:hypothetical protein
VLIKTAADRLHPYIVVSLLTDARTEELRALRWKHVHLEGRATAIPSVPPYIEVWRSVRATGDTKTRRSRRTFAVTCVVLSGWCPAWSRRIGRRASCGTRLCPSCRMQACPSR